MSYSLESFRRNSPWLQGVREQMRALRLSPRTEQAYIHYVADFVAWLKFKTPETITSEDVTGYLSMLATERHVAASTQNVAFNALLFLFRRVLEKDFGEVKATRAAPSLNVPQWLTRDELGAVLKHLDGDWALLARLGYGTGLRLMELLRVRVKDLDFGNGLIFVRDGKGGKDRPVPMPKTLVEPLRGRVAETKRIHVADLRAGFGSVFMPESLAAKYPNAAKDFKWQYVFPSRDVCRADDGTMRRHHLFPNGFQTALRLAGERAGISKRVHPHILRHSYATHFLENGGGLQMLQKLLGHKEVTTTMIYTHCVDMSAARSPLDQLG